MVALTLAVAGCGATAELALLALLTAHGHSMLLPQSSSDLRKMDVGWTEYNLMIY